MAGIRTDLNGAQDASAGYVEPLKISSNEAGKKLSMALGKSITTTQVQSILTACARIRSMRNAMAQNSTTQSIKRTLKAISILSPDAAAKSFHNCDESTRAEIEAAMHCDLRAKYLCPYPDLIPRAAEAALRNVVGQKLKGGRPRKGYQVALARLAVNTWIELADDPNPKVWRGTSNGCVPLYMPPLMKWASTIFALVENHPADSSQLEQLLNDAVDERRITR